MHGKPVFLLVVAAMMLTPLSQAAGRPDSIQEWYLGDQARIEGSSLGGIAFDTIGSLFIADYGRNRSLKLDPGGALTAWGGPGNGPGQFMRPSDVEVGPDGLIYVADMLNHRIQVFDSDGTLMRILGSPGTGEGEFRFPRGLGFDGSGNVYVADALNYRVQLLTADGEFLDVFGTGGDGPGEFGKERVPGDKFYFEEAAPYAPTSTDRYFTVMEGPGDLAIGPEGNLFVLDPVNHRIQKFTPAGEFLAEFGSLGVAPGCLCGMQGLAVDGQGFVYVADTGNRRVQVYTSTGVFVTGWDRFTLTGRGKSRSEHLPGEGVQRNEGLDGGLGMLSASAERCFTDPVSVGITQSGRIGVVQGDLCCLHLFAFASSPVRGVYDLTPSGCPNRWDRLSEVPVSVALAGAPGLDVHRIDAATLVQEGSGSPSTVRIQDILGPPATAGGCATWGPDGHADLVMTFEAEQMRAAVGEAKEIELTLVGAFLNGTPLWGSDDLLVTAVPPNRRGGPRENYERASFELPSAAPVTLVVFDVAGRLVERVSAGMRPAGRHEIRWDVSRYPSGVFFYRLEAGALSRTEKFIIVR